MKIGFRCRDIQPIFSFKSNSLKYELTTYDINNQPTITSKEVKLPTKRTMQKTSLAFGKLAIFALV